MANRNELAAIIWDMDGVLVDTKDFHYQAWQDIYQRFANDKAPLSRNLFDSIFGMQNAETVESFFGSDQATPEFIKEVAAKKEALFRAKIRGRANPLPGVLSWLSYFQDHGLSQAVASSAPERNVQAILGELRIRAYFAVVLSGDSPGEELHPLDSKPAPAIFLEAARQLNVSPESCLVIEDSVVGVQAAKAATMACLAISTTHPISKLAQADWQIDDFRDLDPLTVLEMFASPGFRVNPGAYSLDVN